MPHTRAQTRALEHPTDPDTPAPRSHSWTALLHCRHYQVSLVVQDGQWRARAALLNTRGEDADRPVDVVTWTELERQTAANLARRTLEGVGAGKSAESWDPVAVYVTRSLTEEEAACLPT